MTTTQKSIEEFLSSHRGRIFELNACLPGAAGAIMRYGRLDTPTVADVMLAVDGYMHTRISTNLDPIGRFQLDAFQLAPFRARGREVCRLVSTMRFYQALTVVDRSVDPKTPTPPATYDDIVRARAAGWHWNGAFWERPLAMEPKLVDVRWTTTTPDHQFRILNAAPPLAWAWEPIRDTMDRSGVGRVEASGGQLLPGHYDDAPHRPMAGAVWPEKIEPSERRLVDGEMVRIVRAPVIQFRGYTRSLGSIGVPYETVEAAQAAVDACLEKEGYRFLSWTERQIQFGEKSNEKSEDPE